MTQEALGEVLNRSHNTIGRWETGEREPSLSDLRACCDVLGVSADVLIGRNPVPTKRYLTDVIAALVAETPGDADLVSSLSDAVHERLRRMAGVISK